MGYRLLLAVGLGLKEKHLLQSRPFGFSGNISRGLVFLYEARPAQGRNQPRKIGGAVGLSVKGRPMPMEVGRQYPEEIKL